MSIQIFACDYRKIKEKWNLPFIRIGNNHSNAIINIGDGLENNRYSPKLSELDQIWWIWQHLEEFGNPNYVGFCHYRRFFSKYINQPIVNINKNQLDLSLILTPIEEHNLINGSNAVGASMFPICVAPSNLMIWEQIEYLEKQMDALTSKKLFDIFLTRSPNRLKEHIRKSFHQEKQYLCNIFTLRRDLFNELSSFLFPSIIEFELSLNDDFRKKQHPRYLGYYCERLISCYLHAIQLMGEKILHLPLLTLDCQIHNKVIIGQNGFKEEILTS